MSTLSASTTTTTSLSWRCDCTQSTSAANGETLQTLSNYTGGVGDCCELCLDTAECEQADYNGDMQTCKLMSGVTIYQAGLSDDRYLCTEVTTTTPRPEVDGTCTCETGGLVSGTKITTISGATQETCCDECLLTDGCVLGFVHQSTFGGYCSLYSEVDAIYSGYGEDYITCAKDGLTTTTTTATTTAAPQPVATTAGDLDGGLSALGCGAVTCGAVGGIVAAVVVVVAVVAVAVYVSRRKALQASATRNSLTYVQTTEDGDV